MAIPHKCADYRDLVKTLQNLEKRDYYCDKCTNSQY